MRWIEVVHGKAQYIIVIAAENSNNITYIIYIYIYSKSFSSFRPVVGT